MNAASVSVGTAAAAAAAVEVQATVGVQAIVGVVPDDPRSPNRTVVASALDDNVTNEVTEATPFAPVVASVVTDYSEYSYDDSNEISDDTNNSSDTQRRLATSTARTRDRVPVLPPSTTATATTLAVRAQRNIERCARMRHSQTEWHQWRREFQRLKRHHCRLTLEARLHADPIVTWTTQLTKAEKWRKATVLCLLRLHRRHDFDDDTDCDTDNDEGDSDAADAAGWNTTYHDFELPDPLTEANFESMVPPNAAAALIPDRDVFLARLNTRHSQSYYARRATDQLVVRAQTLPSQMTATTTAAAATAATHHRVSFLSTRRGGDSSTAMTTATTTTSQGTTAQSSGGGGGSSVQPRRGRSSPWTRSSSNGAAAAATTNLLTVPVSLTSDPLVWMYIVRRHASLLISPPGPGPISAFCATIPETLWHDACFFRAVCDGIRRCATACDTTTRPPPWHDRCHDDDDDNCDCCCSTHWSMDLFQAVLLRFDPVLRNDPTTIRPIVEAWTTASASCQSNGNNNGKQQQQHDEASRPCIRQNSLFEFIRLLLKPPTSECHSHANVDSATKLLRNDTAFALYLIDLVPTLPSNALKAFSKRLQNHLDFVMAVVTKNGLCLQYAAYYFRRNMLVCKAACDSNPRALFYCRAMKLRKDPNRVAQYFSQSPPVTVLGVAFAVTSCNDVYSRLAWDLRLYQELLACGQGQVEVSYAALQAGLIQVSDLPRSIQSNEEYWKRILSVRPEAWFQLPVDTTPLQYTVELGRALETIPTIELAEDLFLRLPEFFFDRTVWLKIVASPTFGEMAFDFLEIAPNMVWHDKEIMIKAIRQNYEILELLNDYPLYEDRDVLMAAIKCGVPEVLYEMNAWVQVMHPDLIAHAIRTCMTDTIWDVYDSIEEPLWHDQQIVYAWLSRGGDYLHDDFLPEIASDKKAFLLIAEHIPEEFCNASIDLCTNKEYLAQVLEINPTLFVELPKPLAHDFDLALIALGGSATPSTMPTSAEVKRKRRDLVGLYDVNDPDDFAFLTDFASHVHDQVASHENFVSLILGGMMIGIANRKGSHLGTLNQGDETSLVYKKLLADFIGVPIGHHVKVLRRAAANLVRWGY